MKTIETPATDPAPDEAPAPEPAPEDTSKRTTHEILNLMHTRIMNLASKRMCLPPASNATPIAMRARASQMKAIERTERAIDESRAELIARLAHFGEDLDEAVGAVALVEAAFVRDAGGAP